MPRYLLQNPQVSVRSCTYIIHSPATLTWQIFICTGTSIEGQQVACADSQHAQVTTPRTTGMRTLLCLCCTLTQWHSCNAWYFYQRWAPEKRQKHPSLAGVAWRYWLASWLWEALPYGSNIYSPSNNYRVVRAPACFDNNEACILRFATRKQVYRGGTQHSGSPSSKCWRYSCLDSAGPCLLFDDVCSGKFMCISAAATYTTVSALGTHQHLPCRGQGTLCGFHRTIDWFAQSFCSSWNCRTCNQTASWLQLYFTKTFGHSCKFTTFQAKAYSYPPSSPTFSLACLKSVDLIEALSSSQSYGICSLPETNHSLNSIKINSHPTMEQRAKLFGRCWRQWLPWYQQQ